jgi:hypothetical protein
LEAIIPDDTSLLCPLPGVSLITAQGRLQKNDNDGASRIHRYLEDKVASGEEVSESRQFSYQMLGVVAV